MGAQTTRLGFEAKLYLVGGTDESPTFTRMTDISETSLELTRAEIDTDTGEGLIVTTAQGRMTVAVPGKIIDDFNAVGYTQLENSILARGTSGVIRIMALNGEYDEDGVRGYAFDAMNYVWSDSKGLGNAIYKDFNLKPCRSTWKKKVVIAGGVPVLTDIG